MQSAIFLHNDPMVTIAPSEALDVVVPEAKTPVALGSADPVALLLGAAPLLLSFLAQISELVSPAVLLTLATVALVCTGCLFFRAHRGLQRGQIGLLTLHTAMLFWFYVPAFVTALSFNQWEVSAVDISISNSDAVRAFTLIALFHLILILTYQWKPPARVRSGWLQLIGNGIRLDARTILWVVSGLALVAFAFYSLQAGDTLAAIDFAVLGRSAEKPWSSDGNFGTQITPFHFTAQAMQVVAAICSLTLILLGKLRGVAKGIALVLALVCAAWVSIDEGTRSNLIMVLAPPLILYYDQLRQPGTSRRVLRYTNVGLVLLALVVATDLQLSYRETGKLDNPLAVQVRDNDFFSYTAFAVAVQEEEASYTGDSIIAKLVTGAIPHSLWPEEPYPKSIVVFSRYVWGVDITETGGNTLPSIVGQKYLSQGPRGVVEVAMALGLLLALGDSVFRRATLSGRLLYATVLAYIFVSFRSMTFSFFTYVLFLGALAFLARLLTRLSLEGRRSQHLRL